MIWQIDKSVVKVNRYIYNYEQFNQLMKFIINPYVINQVKVIETIFACNHYLFNINFHYLDKLSISDDLN